jgi:hypothetical protein
MSSKKKSPVPATTTAPPAHVNFALRPPSQSWERLVPADCPQNWVWAWFKPPTVPQGLIVKVPDEAYRDHPQLAEQWTMRKLLQTAGIDPATVATWCVYGIPCNGMNGTNPYFDAPIPRPAPGADPHLVVHIPFPVIPVMPAFAPPVMATPAPLAGVVPPMMQQAAAASPASSRRPAGHVVTDRVTLDIYERIEADWSSSLETEKDLSRLRKQLTDMMGRLKSLNRDLTGPERVHSNSQDRKDWLEARRGLRDASTRLWKYVKAHDIGDTSSAGQRKWFDQTHAHYIAPRRQMENLEQAQHNFESYRKQIQTLHSDMSNALSVASLDGERRAQQVISRITQKVREATNKKNFLGVILDK